jgi:predicted HTH transcriptional regulator
MACSAPTPPGSTAKWLDDRQLIRSGPFDASPCPQASLADLDAERMAWFIDRARQVRGFPLPPNASASELLTHLNLLSHGQPTHAAVLLFGRQPQRFLISSEVKAAHFHGTAATTQAPAAYEIPPEVIREAIVNAVAHRDYTSNGSVQVMVFADRVEIWNPGSGGDLEPRLGWRSGTPAACRPPSAWPSCASPKARSPPIPCSPNPSTSPSTSNASAPAPAT